jgi:glycosyltransferase involved in cell wall biosynthesis
MKLLLVTQVVDSTDTSLGFFHSWIRKLADYFEEIHVICLYEGVHTLPTNVQVYSLGKERGRASRTQYSLRFLKLIWRLRKKYDSVFVHMNQEYVLLGGVLWKVLSKKIYLWKNHYAGSIITRIAGRLCERVFCTSVHSFTAHFKNTRRMPVGVDIERFTAVDSDRKQNSILFLGRMTPSKKPDILLKSLVLLEAQGISVTATFCGPVLPKDRAYVQKLKELAQPLGHQVTFLDGVSHSLTSEIYKAHEIYVNLGASGMLDKTLFEAAASGCVVVSISKDFSNQFTHPITLTSEDPEILAATLRSVLALSEPEKKRIQEEQKLVAKKESLDVLIQELSSVILAPI